MLFSHIKSAAFGEIAPLVRAIRAVVIAKRRAIAERNLALLLRNLRNDLLAKRLFPHHASALDSQIAQWMAEISDECAALERLNVNIFQMRNP